MVRFSCIISVDASQDFKLKIAKDGQPMVNDVPKVSYAQMPAPRVGPAIPSHERGVPDEQRLMNYLFQGYERTVRPVRNASTPVVIRMGLTLTQIFDMVNMQLFVSFLYLPVCNLKFI
ncbi:hypothetical protein DPMN_086504 [Dreissena polymorpha]|uniref:Neurotransmitter-gated ion-channel ligand-binding domain-containing protein n=1 Tax=Dreissena polymorpha TaxID=45954 RepID=A0A9D4KRB9_DREPO|nr:hypothetical protein DPMN_105840 [Dreissena polymorpha]KAH3844248.1 hypothetical protein DPMN_086504 [Dreissena polymorpha]